VSLTRCCSMAPMADMEASVISASGADGSGCSTVARDKLALHSSKALRSSGAQVMGWEPFTLGPERTSCSGAWVAATWGRNRLEKFSMPEIDRADWQSWEGGSPGDGSLVLPEVGNLRRTPCNRGR
jgi:hypothetical protein